MKSRPLKPKQPGEVLTLCDGYRPIRDLNKILKDHGLVVKMRSDRANLGDQVFLRIEKLPAKPPTRLV